MMARCAPSFTLLFVVLLGTNIPSAIAGDRKCCDDSWEACNSCCGSCCAPDCMDQLVRMSECQLENIYRQACAGQMPHGFTPGKAIFFPGSCAAVPLSKVVGHAWEGKIFNACSCSLKNKVFGREAVPARVYCGQSWFDGQPSIILDYRGESKLASKTRDEIREIAPGLYLGIMYRDGLCKHRMICWFTVDARKACCGDCCGNGCGCK